MAHLSHGHSGRVQSEPDHLLPVPNGPNLVPDWALYGVQSEMATQAFDLMVVDPLCSSIVTKIVTKPKLNKNGLVPPLAATKVGEKMKNNKYSAICKDNGIDFYPFVIDSYGGASLTVQQLCSSWHQDTIQHNRLILDSVTLLDELRIILVKTQLRMRQVWIEAVSAPFLPAVLR